MCLVLIQRHRLGEQEANLRDNSSLCFYTRDLGCPQRGSDLCNAVHLACQAVLLPFFVAADRPDMCPLNGFVIKPSVLMAATLSASSEFQPPASCPFVVPPRWSETIIWTALIVGGSPFHTLITTCVIVFCPSFHRANLFLCFHAGIFFFFKSGTLLLSMLENSD